MIGAGLFLSVVSTVIHTVVTAIEHFSEQSQNITMPDYSSSVTVLDTSGRVLEWNTIGAVLQGSR